MELSGEKMMYYYYAVVQTYMPNGYSIRDSVGFNDSRAEAMKYLWNNGESNILNLIEITEEEYLDFVETIKNRRVEDVE